eukprot:4272724-Alexandrium_andersonii.AAC.1
MTGPRATVAQAQAHTTRAHCAHVRKHSREGERATRALAHARALAQTTPTRAPICCARITRRKPTRTSPQPAPPLAPHQRRGPNR